MQISGSAGSGFFSSRSSTLASRLSSPSPHGEFFARSYCNPALPPQEAWVGDVYRLMAHKAAMTVGLDNDAGQVQDRMQDHRLAVNEGWLVGAWLSLGICGPYQRGQGHYAPSRWSLTLREKERGPG